MDEETISHIHEQSAEDAKRWKGIAQAMLPPSPEPEVYAALIIAQAISELGAVLYEIEWERNLREVE